MKRIMASLLAAGVLVAAAAVVVVAVGGSAADAQEPPPPPAPRWQLEDPDGVPFGYQGGAGMGRQSGYLMSDIWEDGVISTDELALLPEGHPLTDPDGPAAPFLEGGITAEEHEQIRAECDGTRYEARAEWRAERWADREAFRAARQGDFEARAELRAQHQAECAESDDCPYEPAGPGFGGRGYGRGGPNV
jgi:hypothetical protein